MGIIDGHRVLRFIAERNGVHTNKALNGRAGCGHQQESQSDLARDEGSVHASSFHTARKAARAGLHDLADLGLRRLQRGEESEDNSAEDCQAHAEKQDRQVDVEVGFVGIGVVGKPGNDEPDRSIGDEHSQPCPDTR